VDSGVSMAIRRFVDGKGVRCDDTVVFRKRKGDERERRGDEHQARKQGEEREGRELCVAERGSRGEVALTWAWRPRGEGNAICRLVYLTASSSQSTEEVEVGRPKVVLYS
jgi:hypothetical protein